ncbi:MAG: hypothetical protein FJY75_05765 [Candidatus Eisenbacteria bacterium]|uniref:Uncharacterized protein n=1 Tax=Eiseniibacteriota bacterium TaxID=2212470 RepID=A0A938BQK8_UNCEI|nr:hypothetical protein [Candidatus Eisenbacteria bacterium]
MGDRSGERYGWLGGWGGTFLWVLILAVVWLARGRMAAGITGLALTGLALGAILSTAPWRRPGVPYWKLMLPLYGLLAVAVVWALWSFDALRHPDFSLWTLLPLTAALTPLGTIGRRRWTDGDVPTPGA